MTKNRILGLALVLGLGLLAACDTAEERAEKHYQTALEHLENGDVDRAIIEFRNVFKLNGFHKEARLTFARMQRERGATPEAYSQYLRLVEQYPDNLEGRKALAEMAVETADWDEVERHGRAAAEIAPDDPLVRSVLAALEYRAATLSRNEEAKATAFDAAQALLETDPGLIAAHQLVVDKLLQERDWDGVLAALDAALLAAPDMMQFYTIRLGVLDHLDDDAAVEAQLKQMRARFPEDADIEALLLDWYLDKGNFAAAEILLRDRIDPDAADPDDQVRLVRFLRRYRDSAAALAELEQALATPSPHETVYRTLRAAITYEEGDADAAIADLDTVLDGAEPSADTDNAKVTLARMLAGTGDQARAEALVDEVLTSDRRHVEAIRMKARWLIEDDRTGDAIALLRVALGESPQDAQLMTLMASAHERDGNRDLMAEMLSLATEASGSAPGEALRYATYLAEENQGLNAEAVLLDALRQQPDNIPLLGALGTLYIDLQDWPRAQGVVTRLEAFDDESATAIAHDLTARVLAGQGNEQALTDFLETLSQDEQTGRGAEIALIRSYVARGDTETALSRLDAALRETPGDPGLRFVRASVLAIANRLDEAETEFDTLLRDQPDTEQAWLGLYRLKVVAGKTEDAAQVLDDALAALPQSIPLRWTRAGRLEQQGDIDGAIGIYQTLYDENSAVPVFANNLASLLASHRDDADSLEQAYVIARRLRGSDIPAFQDTYGWIAYRRGDLDEALAHLEPAAAGLPGDPAVQYHLGATYAALDRKAEAQEAFERALALTPPAPLRDTVQAAISGLDELGGLDGTSPETGTGN